MKGFPEAARHELRNAQLRHNLRHATHTIRDKRARAVAEVDDWEQLREAGRRIKTQAIRHLDTHLETLERSVAAAGGTVHWAADAAEANRIVTGLVQAAGASEVVKVKSITTDEIGLGPALEAAGITSQETDLAELIIQLAHDRPSHILVPAIHFNRSEIRALFRRELPGTEALTDDPEALCEAARRFLREKFLSAQVAISGANFAVAETGTVVVLESEGNGRMCTTLPRTLITVMGIEKVLPRFEDLGVMLQLLPRSSTAERMNPYTSLWTGVTPGDGPQEFHLVLLDAGRTDTLADSVGRDALHCIRCSACLNVCPVYERTGGHAYGSTYPGPIGAILTPQLAGLRDGTSLPWASSLCGACYEVCPVKIDIPSILVHLRGRVVREHPEAVPTGERAAMRTLASVLGNRRRYELAQRAARVGAWPLSRDGRIERRLPGPLAGWTAVRDLPAPPKQTFREWWRRTRPRLRGVSSRELILGRIRSAVADVPAEEPAAWTRAEDLDPAAAYALGGERDRETLLDLFAERCGDYRATVTRCADDPGSIAAAVGEACARQGAGAMVVAPDLDRGWLPEGLEVRIDGSPSLSLTELDAIDGVITGCGLAIAVTGTIALDAGPGQGRRALTLVPDLHVCVVRGEQVVYGVVNAVQALGGAVRRSGQPLTLISGPSATSDIELERVEGVHGPRRLEVVLAG